MKIALLLKAQISLYLHFPLFSDHDEKRRTIFSQQFTEWL
jgi:hypothetical protein